MDTIIYFYKKRGLKEPAAEPVGLKAYMLVRVAMDVGAQEWFGRSISTGEAEEEEMKETGEILGEGIPADDSVKPQSSFREVMRHPLRAIRQTRLYKQQQKQIQEHLYQAKERETRLRLEREELLCAIEAAMGKLKADVMELSGDMGNCFCVYEDGIRRALVGEGDERASEDWQREFMATGEDKRRTLASMWRSCFSLPEFGGYGRIFWVERLLPKAQLPHFVILGTSPDIYRVIEGIARRMKSLRWILLKESCNQDLLDFVEDFYTEYGLAVTLQPMEEGETYRRLRLVCRLPVNVLDFTVEPHITVSEVAEGSIWLDMMSVEEKQRRITGRGRGIVYHSLKEEWRHAQKRCNCPIVP